MNPIIKYLAALLLPSFLLLACRKEPVDQNLSEEQVTATVHYRATVSEGPGTRAGLNGNNQYVFEEGDRLYVTNAEGTANSLYGFLSLASQPGQTTAMFEGDLICTNGFTPADDTQVTVTLVSKEDQIHTCENGKLTGTTYPSEDDQDHSVFASSFAEAVRRFSHFTDTGTYGKQSFSLTQHSTFLVFAISLSGTEEKENLTAEIKNGASTLRTGTVSAKKVDLTLQANFVAAFDAAATNLSGATISIKEGDNQLYSGGIADQNLEANKFYTVSRPDEAPYFTIQATQPGTVVRFHTDYISSHKIQYQKNGNGDGAWTTLSAETNGISLNASEYILVRAKGRKFTKVLFTVDENKLCYIYGDIMSLICDGTGDTYTKRTELYSDSFKGIFKGTNYIDIPSGRPLKLTATTLQEACYKDMFSGCTSLTHPPVFSADAASVPNNACNQMFYGCTSLQTAPELPATSVGESGYQNMFKGCTALASAPSQLASNLTGTSCFNGMFSGCTSLPAAPKLPAQTIPESGYNEMFMGCTSLQEAPDLPAETINNTSYQRMFQNCSALTKAPQELKAAKLYQSCYKQMFQNCSALMNMPDLPATDGAAQCYFQMFAGCLTLNKAAEHIYLKSIPQSGCFQMFYGCISLVNAPEMPSVTSVDQDGCNAMFWGCTELATTPPALPATSVGKNGYYQMFYNCPKIISAPSLGMTDIIGESACQQMFYGCSRLVTPPEQLSPSTLPKSVYQEMFSGCSSLRTAPAFTAIGVDESSCRAMFLNCNNLQSADNIILSASQLVNNCYHTMFSGCTVLAKAPTVSAESSADYCCYRMFKGCSRLASAGSINIAAAGPLGLECFREMFSGCSGMTAAPSISATSTADYCCYQMFKGCSRLASAGSINIAAAGPLGLGCFREMFSGCSGMTAAPSISATSTADYSCYQMFYNCSSMTSAETISLKANLLAHECYYMAFYGCSSITKAPVIGPVAEGDVVSMAIAEGDKTDKERQCEQMFRGCSSLTDISGIALKADLLSYNCYREMFSGCTSLSSAPALPATQLAQGCYRAMFENSAITTAPELPATTLAEYCYYYMMAGCKSLEGPVFLPAQTLVANCYGGMFNGASKLDAVTCLAVTTVQDATKDWLKNVSNLGIFTKPGTVTWWTRGASGIPTNWVVRDYGLDPVFNARPFDQEEDF